MDNKTQNILQKFSTHKVEFANINQLVSLISKSRSDEGEMVESFVEAKEKCNTGIKAAERHIRNLKEVEGLANEIEDSAKELGVDASSIKEWRRAKDFLNGNPRNATEIMISKMKSLL